MGKLSIGMVILLTLNLTGCSNNNNVDEEEFVGDILVVTEVEQRENSGTILEDIYVTTDNTDTSEEQLEAIFNELNGLKNEEDEKNVFTQVSLSDGKGNRLGVASELGGLVIKLDSIGSNNNQFKLNYSSENESKLMMKE